MVLKRQFGEEGSDKSSPFNYSNSSPAKLQKVFQYVMNENSLQEIAVKISTIIEPTLRRVVKEEVEPLIAALFNSPTRLSVVGHQEALPSRGLQLIFVSKLPSTLFTNSRIEDEEHAPLQVQLIDAKSRNVVSNGPLSSIKVEIVALTGDFSANERENWTESKFNESIVREREGKRPLLIGELSIVLNNGVGFIRNITFTDNSSWIRSRKFKLGVRAFSSGATETSIREAVSESFVVLDHRGESYQKHSTPSLDDPVWRLRKISKLGASHKKLESLGIKTVHDFLMHYHMNPQNLRHMLGKGIANRAWDTMVSHANECQLDDTIYYRYWGETEAAQLLFNCVYKVIAVKFGNHDYQPIDSLDSYQRNLVEKLKQSAFSNMNQIVLVQSLSAPPFPTEIPNAEHSIQYPTAQPDSFSMINQDEADKQLDFNLSDTSSYPCTAIEDGYLPEDDSTSPINQPAQGFSHAAFCMNNTSGEPSGSGYDNWYLDNSAATFAQNNLFGEFSHPLGETWGAEDGVLSTTYPTSHSLDPFQTPNFGASMSGTGTPKAGWCKIRAAVMWKIVRRKAVARRKGKFPFGYY